MDLRRQQLITWLKRVLNVQSIRLTPLAGDASFRRYFRIKYDHKQLIAMDSPPDKEPCQPYILIADALAKAGLTVPQILEKSSAEGFLLISDLGKKLFANEVSSINANQYYHIAIEKLLQMQEKVKTSSLALQSFANDRLQSELDNFTDWFLQQYLEIRLTEDQQKTVAKTYQLLIENVKEQPEVFIHLDYHSRNLISLPNDVGILDFQDAMIGPATYDLVSLIRDCYVDWPVVQVNHWALQYREQAISRKLIPEVSKEKFLRWFDLMGMQRHLKATFIFARKFLRDNNKNYLENIPRTLNYIKNVCQRHPELQDFTYFLSDEIFPKLQKKLKED